MEVGELEEKGKLEQSSFQCITIARGILLHKNGNSGPRA
jgi:hypothetical protein